MICLINQEYIGINVMETKARNLSDHLNRCPVCLVTIAEGRERCLGEISVQKEAGRMY